jgi:hypothetical protein
MRSAIAVLLAAIPAFSQVASRTTPAAASMPANAAPIVGGAPKAEPKQAKTSLKVPLSAFVSIERTFDARLAGLAVDKLGPVDALGATRGVYLDGYGAVFTAQIGLIVTPTVNPFNPVITDAQKTRVHSDKVTRLPALKKVMTEYLRSIAGSLTQLPETQQIVLAVRLDYLSWENTSGLPGIIIAKADRRSAAAGNITLEEQ